MADITRLRPEEQAVVDAFHRLYYPFFGDTRWMGVEAQKCPFDLFVYQELILELRPDLIVECGTASGGSATFLASICQLVGHGEVVSIDIDNSAGKSQPLHPRLSYVQGDTLSPDTLQRISELVAGKQCVLVILDDDHNRDHVLEELRCYGRFVTNGSYLVVEDSNVNGNPVLPEFGPGPMEAIETFMQQSNEFEIDRSREKFLISFNPKGFLKKRGEARHGPSQYEAGVPAPGEDLLQKLEIIKLQARMMNEMRLKLESMQRDKALMENSLGWQMLQRYRRLRNRLLPANTPLRRWYEQLRLRLISKD